MALLEPTAFHTPLECAHSIGVTMRRAGHVLGSAHALLTVGGTRVLFTGDLGRPDHPLLLPPEAAPPADHVVLESTYGDRSHEPDARTELGMATGGRVLHHLAHELPHSRNTVVLTGHQVPGTRGHALAQGATALKIHGHYVPVRAEVVDVHGYSAHVDREQMVGWLAAMPEPRTAYVVHGEPDSSAALAATLHERLGWNAVVPRMGERVSLAEPAGQAVPTAGS